MSGDTRSLRSGQALTTTAKYVWEGNSYYDPLMYERFGDNWYHPMTDGLGSTRQLLDNTTQNVTDEYAYEAFGNLMDSSGSTPNPYKYVGSLGYYGTGSSLMHLGARYYLPEVGRFISPRAHTTGFALQRWNRALFSRAAWTMEGFVYARNSPTTYVQRSPARRYDEAARDRHSGFEGYICAAGVFLGCLRMIGSGTWSDLYVHCVCSCLLITECRIPVTRCKLLGELWEHYPGQVPDSDDLIANGYGCDAGNCDEIQDEAGCVDHCSARYEMMRR